MGLLQIQCEKLKKYKEETQEQQSMSNAFQKTLQMLTDKQPTDIYGFQREIDRIRKDKRKSDNHFIVDLLDFYDALKTRFEKVNQENHQTILELLDSLVSILQN